MVEAADGGAARDTKVKPNGRWMCWIWCVSLLTKGCQISWLIAAWLLFSFSFSTKRNENHLHLLLLYFSFGGGGDEGGGGCLFV